MLASPTDHFTFLGIADCVPTVAILRVVRVAVSSVVPTVVPGAVPIAVPAVASGIVRASLVLYLPLYALVLYALTSCCSYHFAQHGASCTLPCGFFLSPNIYTYFCHGTGILSYIFVYPF